MRTLLIIITYILTTTGLFAKAGTTAMVSAAILSEVNSVKPGSEFYAAIKLKIAKGWHIYWKNPGDAGLPTSIEWILPDGMKAGDINWPLPEKVLFSGLAEFGYENEVILPVKITLSGNIKIKTAKIRASVKWLVCREKCFPGSASLELTLPVKKDLEINSSDKKVIDTVLDKIPAHTAQWNFSARYDDKVIDVYIKPPDWYEGNLEGLDVFPEQQGYFKYANTIKVEKKGGQFIVRLKLDNLRIGDPKVLNAVFVYNGVWNRGKSQKAVRVSIPVDY